MKVRALRDFSSARYGYLTAGKEFDCDDNIALQWASAGMVEPVAPPAEYETAVVEQKPRRRRTKAKAED